MDKSAEKYYSYSAGIWIRNSPAVLALFFNTGDNLMERSAKKRKLNPCCVDKKVELTISQNQMATWIDKNINQFSMFKTEPNLPDSCYQFATTN